jgi:hypothetical protein
MVAAGIGAAMAIAIASFAAFVATCVPLSVVLGSGSRLREPNPEAIIIGVSVVAAVGIAVLIYWLLNLSKDRPS